MTKIDDHAFFDVLLQQFARTTRAADTFWMPEKQEDSWISEGSGTDWVEWMEPGDGWDVFAVDQEQQKTKVGHFENEVDADFITAVHGCFPDLVRRLHAALDEADRADREHDEREQQIGRLSVENMELRQQVEQIGAAIGRLEGQLDTQRSKAADVLWKSERWT